MKKSNMKTFLLGLIFLALVFSGCESSSDPSDSGSLVVKITDDPFPANYVEEALINIEKIEVRKKSNSDGNSFIVILEENLEFNLLLLRNGITAELPEIEIPVGSYDLVRLYITSAKILLKDGKEFNLKIPSGEETGIKIFIDPELQIQGGLTAELLLDFDLSNSFVVQGNLNSIADINGFIFTPVIRAANNSLTGSIFGKVKDSDGPLENVLVTVNLEEGFATAVSNIDGYYEILGLKVSDNYSVSAVLEGYRDESVSKVVVRANEKTEYNFEMVKQ